MMRPWGLVICVASLFLLPGCASNRAPDARTATGPLDWDEEAPDHSELATKTAYPVTQSSSFLVKGASYARYLIRIDQAWPAAEVFFTSTNERVAGLEHPDANRPEYHYEFMQLRPLGKTVRVMDVSAGPAFKNASTGHTLTLAYIYGRGANYQHFVPYDGDPGHWDLSPGYYELVIATDENLTVGVNIKLGTPLWTTYYHPQELGDSRKGALESYVRIWPGATPRSLHEELHAYTTLGEGENLNLFAYSNLIYQSNFIAVGTQGTVRVRIDDAEVPHRLEGSGLTPTTSQRNEAYAYAVSFNEPGPVKHQIRTKIDFDETLSYDSNLAASMLIFGVVLKPTQTLADLPKAGP